jgi:hypothetical protein
MATDADGGVLYAVADEIGIDADRFRLAQGAKLDRLYLTGIELALAAAGVVVHRFLRGYTRGLWEGLAEAGLDPDQLGERWGRTTARAIHALGERAASLLGGPPDAVLEQVDDFGAEINETLREAAEIAAQLPEDVRAESRAGGVGEIAAVLVENGFTEERAAAVAIRLANELAPAHP